MQQNNTNNINDSPDDTNNNYNKDNNNNYNDDDNDNNANDNDDKTTDQHIRSFSACFYDAECHLSLILEIFFKTVGKDNSYGHQ